MSIKPASWVAKGSAIVAFFMATATVALAQPIPDPANAVPDRSRMTVDSGLRPARLQLTGRRGEVLSISASRDSDGVQSDFVDGVLVLKPRSPEELQTFLQRYGGTVIATDAVEPTHDRDFPAALAAHLRAPVHYAIRVDLRRVRPAEVWRQVLARGPHQDAILSSDAGRRTLAVMLDGQAAGYHVQLDTIEYGQQSMPKTLLGSKERGGADALSDPGFGARFGAWNAKGTDDKSDDTQDGAHANVVAAWQFIAAHGFDRRVRVAIIDGGFWLDSQGRARGSDSDFPTQKPLQWDVIDDDDVADGPNPGSCTNGFSCPWHGTGSAAVATGLLDNGLGNAGVGALVSDPILIKSGFDFASSYTSVRRAVAMGADVVSMSYGGKCNYWCRQGIVSGTGLFPDVIETGVFDDLVENGSRTVFIAAAGNDGVDVGSPNFYHPCTEAHVICVGALNDNSLLIDPRFNFGSRVTILAPQDIETMSYPPAAAGSGLIDAVPGPFNATSSATPYVAGVAAMIKAINPGLNTTDVERIIVATAQPGQAAGTRVIDALAAVRLAADGRPPVKDRLENEVVHDFGLQSDTSLSDLNIAPGLSDSFRFAATGASDADITVEASRSLGTIDIGPVSSADGDCPVAVLTASQDVFTSTSRRRTYHYRVGGGSHQFMLTADDLNAYNIRIKVSDAPVSPDPYEYNNYPEYATKLMLQGIGVPNHASDISATIHTSGMGDIDYYLIRAVAPAITPQSGMGYEAASFPLLQVGGNESPIRLEVFRRATDGGLGAPLLSQPMTSDGCSGNALGVHLEVGVAYYVKVTGKPGRYALYNGTGYIIHRVNYINLENVLTKPGPVGIRAQERFFLPYDPAILALNTNQRDVRLALMDAQTDEQLAMSVATVDGQRLDLSQMPSRTGYLIKVFRQNADPGASQAVLRAEAAPVRRTSDNLIRNGDFEDAQGVRSGGWKRLSDMPELGIYPGVSSSAENAGSVLGVNAGQSGAMRQIVELAPEWRRAIGSGRLKAYLSVDLGGRGGGEGQLAWAELHFLDREQKPIMTATAGPVGALERNGHDGIVSAKVSEPVPAETAYIAVDIRLIDDSVATGSAFADNVSLKLTEYGF